MSSNVFRLLDFLWIALLYSYCCMEIAANSSGAPPSTCESMEPSHSGAGPSLGACPFETQPEQTEIFSNSTLSLTIQTVAESAIPFKGFLIMGFDKATDSVCGTFQVNSTSQIQTLACYETYDTAATHSSSTSKTSVTLEWIPPSDYEGTVVFKTTYVQEMNTFWTKQLSKEVNVLRAATVPTTTLDPPSSTEKPILPDIYAGCGNPGIKGCSGSPLDCIKLKNCNMLTTYRRVDDDYLQLEIYGLVSGDQYVAVGFSIDDEMGVDSVVECAKYRDSVNAFQSFNTLYKVNERLAPQMPEFRLNSSVYADGYIYCNVQHPITYTVNDVSYNLSEPHYLLLASGPTGSGNIQRHTSDESSTSTIVLTEDLGTSYFEEESRVLKELHGSFMVIAWLMAASVGMFMPRYMKKAWPGKQFMGKDMWFVYHQGLMVCSWVLTIVGFILIFVDVGGWVSETVSENPHPLIGCITTVLAFIQPIMATFRPAPSSPNRYIFNWAHTLVGYSAHILAITCIFLAVEMKEAKLPYHTYWILTAHICCYALAHLLLTYFANKEAKAVAAAKTEALKDDRKHANQVFNIWGSDVKKVIVVAFVCIAVGLGITVIVFVAIS